MSTGAHHTSSSDNHDRVRSGLDLLPDWSPEKLQGASLGLLSNHASVDRRFRSAVEVVTEQFPGQLRAIFSPQHGFWAEQQANMIESPDARHPSGDVPIFSLYSKTRRPTPEMLGGLDVLLVDLQDVGTRVYTFVWTVLNCLKACAECGVRVNLLDRPNPLGGMDCEGAVLAPEYRSFVGGACVPMRHGLTLGELCAWLNDSHDIGADLDIVPLSGWTRFMLYPDTGLPWIPPSPNLPTFASALVYPGQVLLEGTNLSEGRGTTTPFELAGAPFLDGFQIAGRLNEAALPGVRFRPTRLRPTFDKWAGEVCGGVSLYVTDPHSYRPYRTTLQLLSTVCELHPREFEWGLPPYEYEDQLMPIDILSGDSRLRSWLDEAGSLTQEQIDELCTEGIDAWRESTRDFRMYE